MSFTYQSPHAGRWIGGNANFPHSGSFYKLLQKFTVDALLDKDSAGTEADFTLSRMTREDNGKTHSFMGRSPCISEHLRASCQALVEAMGDTDKTKSHHGEHTVLWGGQTTAQVNELNQ